MPKAITSTEIVAELIAKQVPINKILNMAYESGKRRAPEHGITGGRAISQWAGDQAVKVGEQIKDIIAK